MANIGHGIKYERAKSKLLHSAAKMFLKQGFSVTKITDITKDAGVDNNAVARVFGEKENLLAELVGLVLDYQFQAAEKLVSGKVEDKIYLYAVETVLQLYITESSEHIRELYSLSYSYKASSKVIYENLTEKLEGIFKKHLPDCDSKDFYELELAAGGIMRSFLTVPCDRYFDIERKVKRFLESTLLVFEVPKEKIKEIVAFIEKFDFLKIAKETVANMLEYLESNT